jgi:hypothetical protein
MVGAIDERRDPSTNMSDLSAYARGLPTVSRHDVDVQRLPGLLFVEKDPRRRPPTRVTTQTFYSPANSQTLTPLYPPETARGRKKQRAGTHKCGSRLSVAHGPSALHELLSTAAATRRGTNRPCFRSHQVHSCRRSPWIRYRRTGHRRRCGHCARK